MNNIKKDSAKKFSKGEDVFAVIMSLGTLSWFPTMGSSLFVENFVDFLLLAIIYVGISFSLFIYIRKRIALYKPIKTLLSVKIICVLAMISLNASLIFLYSYHILISEWSLFFCILFSLFVVFGCVEAWIRGVDVENR